MRLLTDVAADHDTSVAQVLTAVRVVGMRAGVQDLAAWAAKEAGGYAQDDELPAHRIWNLSVVATLHNLAVGVMPNVHVGTLALPEQHRQSATTYRCRDAVGDLEVLLADKSGMGEPMGVEHPELAQLVNAGPLVSEGWACTRADAQFSPIHLMNVITQARQTALTLCLECESNGIELHWLGNEADETEEYRRFLQTLRDENTREGIRAVWSVIRAALFAAAGAMM